MSSVKPIQKLCSLASNGVSWDRSRRSTFVLRSGAPKIYIKTAESGNKRLHAFCPRVRHTDLCGRPGPPTRRPTACGWAPSTAGPNCVRHRRWCRSDIGAVGGEHAADGTARFVVDSPLEGAGFEPSVPLEVLTVGIVSCRLRGPFHASLPKTKFAADSALEGEGFEPLVPGEKDQSFRPSSPFFL
jgi:hypothetical protein